MLLSALTYHAMHSPAVLSDQTCYKPLQTTAITDTPPPTHPHICSSFKDCLRLSQQRGDDIAGVLAAWQAAQTLLCGATGKTFSEAEIKGLISQAGEFKESLRVWGGLGLCGPRITLVGKMVRELLREAKKGGVWGRGGGGGMPLGDMQAYRGGRGEMRARACRGASRRGACAVAVWSVAVAWVSMMGA
jgi:hypothetical protein